MMLPVCLVLFTLHLVAASPVTKPRPPQRASRPIRSRRGSNALGLNSTAQELFERSRRSYERTYATYGRAPAQVQADDLTLDFEIETCAAVQLTPELLLERGGVDLDLAVKSAQQSSLILDSEKEGETMDSEKTTWPKMSKWFTAGIDGTGRFIDQRKGKHFSMVSRADGTYRQDLSGQIELESIMMSPKDVLESDFTKDLQSVTDRLYAAKVKADLAPTATQNKAVGKHSWYKLPFEGAKGINIFGGMDPKMACSKCHVQFTAGLPLHHVSLLLRMSASKPLQDIISRTDKLCAGRQGGCKPDYHAFISLAAWVVTAATQSNGCGHPKRFMAPWLVRTHFGDLAMMIKEKYGSNQLHRISDDVVQVGQLKLAAPILPNGTIDYLRLPEMAELSGMVFPRNPLLHASHKKTEEDMPTDVQGLLRLSKKMLKNQRLIDERLHKRTCRLHSRDETNAKIFTVKDWLDGLQHGKDLMSDHDSPLSQSAFSHMVWKSMGSWRMRPGSDRVYLECRNVGLCLTGVKPQPGPAALIHVVGQSMRDLEKYMKTPPAKTQKKTAVSKTHTLSLARKAKYAGKNWRMRSRTWQQKELLKLHSLQSAEIDAAGEVASNRRVGLSTPGAKSVIRKETGSP